MKIKCNSQLKYRIIDFINDQYWLSAAISITLSGVALLWTIGLIFMINIQNTL